MIEVKFSGGLGNQMFQYAFFLWLTHRYPNCEIKADINSYKYTKFHTGYELKRIFKIDMFGAYNINSPSVIEKILFKILVYAKARWINSSFSKIEIVDGNDPVYNDAILNLENDRHYYMHGVWNSPYYFEGIEKMVKDVFKFDGDLSSENKCMQELIESCDSISMHIRRGDYLNSTYIPLAETKYYENALAFILEKETNHNVNIFIFSDDVDWCKNNMSFLNSYKCVYISHNVGNESYRDMQLMSLCKHNIIANSTFSWWAAWLNDYEKKIVVCPKQYFKFKNYNDKFVAYHYPSEWVKL